MKDASSAPRGSRTAKLRLAGRDIDFRRAILRDAQGNAIDLRPQAWAVLEHLANCANRVATKDELLAAVWPGLVVTDGSVTQAISDVRTALGDAENRIVRTAPRRGYMLVLDDTETAAVAAGDDVQIAVPPSSYFFSIALPTFVDVDPNESGKGLARGFAQELRNELARNAGLRVVSHYSSFAFAGTDTALAEIGRQLRCRNLLDGRVRRDGDQAPWLTVKSLSLSYMADSAEELRKRMLAAAIAAGIPTD